MADGQAEINYENETEEELEARFRAGEGIIIEREDDPEQQLEPEPEQEVSDEADTVEKPTEEAEAEAEPEETAEEPEPEPVSDRDDAIEELRLQLELERAARERSELIGGRAASQLGDLRKQVQALSQRPQAPPQNDDGGYEQYPQQAPPQPSQSPHPGYGDLQAKVAGLEQQERTKALESDLESFRLKNFKDDREAFDKFIDDRRESIQEQLAPYQGFEMDTPVARKLLGITLSMALAEYGLAQKKAAAQERAAAQVPAKKKAKQAATVSGSGGTPIRRPRPKRPEDMTAEEANKALIAEYGDGHYRRR